MIKTVAKYERAPSSLYRIWPESGWRHTEIPMEKDRSDSSENQPGPALLRL